MREFLTFRRMITPVIIQILFWLGVIICVFAGLTMLLTGSTASHIWGPSDGDANGMQRLGGLALMVLGPIACWVYAELLILLFRMNETLSDIRKGLPGASGPAGGRDMAEKPAA